MKTIRKFFSDKKGATAIEYGLIAALIAVAAIAAMSGLGKKLGNTFNEVSRTIANGASYARPSLTRLGRRGESFVALFLRRGISAAGRSAEGTGRYRAGPLKSGRRPSRERGWKYEDR